MKHLRHRLLATLILLGLMLITGSVPATLAAAPTPTAPAKLDRVFYVSGTYDIFGDFYVMNSDGTGVRRLTNGLFTDVANGLIVTNKIPYDPDYMTKGYLLGGIDTSPDGRYVAVCWTTFIVDSTLGGDNLLATQGNLYIVDGNDYSIHKVAIDKLKRWSGIGWSADSKRLAFVAERDGKGQIDVVDLADNFSVKPLIQDDLDKGDPVWSPDGKWIAYTGNKGNDSQLYRADADGKNPLSLTGSLKIDLVPNAKPDPSPYIKHLPEEKWQPNWSPDSQHVLISSLQGVEGAIYVADVDGSTAHVLVPFGKGAGAMWLDNQNIVFFSDREAYRYYQLYGIKADGSGETKLTQTWARLSFVSELTDRQRLLFTNDAGRIYVINVDGTDQHVIKFGANEAIYWEPRQ